MKRNGYLWGFAAGILLVVALSLAMGAATDDFARFQRDRSMPAEHAFSITLDDSNDVSHVTRAFWFDTGGDVVLTTLGGETVTMKVQSGQQVNLAVTRFKSTNTTAANGFGIY